MKRAGSRVFWGVVLASCAIALTTRAQAQSVVAPNAREPAPSVAESAGGAEPTFLPPPSAATGDPALASGEGAPEPDPALLAGLLDSAVVRLAETARADAAHWLDQKQYPRALKALETAHELDPSHTATTERLAELQDALGHAERAEALYRELIALAPDRAAGYVALADLLARDRSRPDGLQEAAALYARAQERLGAEPTLLLKRARLATTRGAYSDAERDYSSYLAKHRPDDALLLELGDFYRDASRPEDALSHYRMVGSGEPARIAAQRMFELEADKEARRYGLVRRDARASDQALAAGQRARLLAGRGQLAAAEGVLREALADSPGLGVLHADLADVLRSIGRADQAELEYLRAISLDGSQPEVYLHLAELYLASQPSRATEAAWLLERALAARPEWPQPHLLLARAYREQGDLPRALLHVTRHLAQTRDGPERDQALVLQASLQTALGAASSEAEPAAAAVTANKLDSGATQLARARTFLARGQTDAALAELRRLDGSDLQLQAFDLQARVLFAAGRLDEAEALLARALGVAEGADAPVVHELLGEIAWARRDADAARRHWRECAAVGRTVCAYRLTQLEAAPSDWGALADLGRVPALVRAHARIGSLIGAAGLPLSAAELVRERAELQARLWTVAGLAGCLALLLGGVALVAQRARFGGLTIAALLERHPQASPQVQRALSAIRHEVLKHNTLMLAGTADALAQDRGAPDAAEHMARALFGPDGQGGAAARFDEYAEELVQVGRVHGERLNLRRRDPALRALYAGLDSVRGLRARLLSVASLSPRARLAVAKRLRRANEQLNVEAQAELGRLLEHLRSLSLTDAQLRALFQRTREEPALAAESIAPLALDPASALPCSVAIPAQSFDEIMINLFRNALEASLRHPTPRPVMVGLRVERELDEITGLARIALHVCDRAPEPLAPDKLRSGYIEAGLGLTADLVARYEGSLEVTAEVVGFSKAVVLRLPEQPIEGP